MSFLARSVHELTEPSMDPYTLLVFVHVLAGVGMFSAWAVEVIAIGQVLRSSDPGAARAWDRLVTRAQKWAIFAMTAVLLTGAWMMRLRWGPQPWLLAAVAGVVALAVVGIIGERRVRRTGAARSYRSVVSRVALGVAILGLMTMKPPAQVSVSFLVVAAAIAALSGLAMQPRPVPVPRAGAAADPRGRERASLRR
jgi:hypothetical protein